MNCWTWRSRSRTLSCKQCVLGLLTAEGHDRRADHDRRQSDGRQRHQNRRDVECEGQDQADGAQDLDCSEGLDEAGAEVVDPSPARSLGQFLLRDEQLVSARHEEDSGQQASDDPQSEVHEFLLVAYLGPSGPVIELSVDAGRVPSTDSLADVAHRLPRQPLHVSQFGLDGQVAVRTQAAGQLGLHRDERQRPAEQIVQLAREAIALAGHGEVGQLGPWWR
jgi:hypothetical protein